MLETKAKEATGCKVFKLSKTNDNSDIIEMIVPILQHGGVVALPTDTIYGLACLAQSTEGIEKLYKIKGDFCLMMLLKLVAKFILDQEY